MSDSDESQSLRGNRRITRSVSKKPDVGQRHVERPSEGEIREKETAREVADGKQQNKQWQDVADTVTNMFLQVLGTCIKKPLNLPNGFFFVPTKKKIHI